MHPVEIIACLQVQFWWDSVQFRKSSSSRNSMPQSEFHSLPLRLTNASSTSVERLYSDCNMKYVVTRAGCFNFLCDAEYILLILQNPWTQWSRV